MTYLLLAVLMMTRQLYFSLVVLLLFLLISNGESTDDKIIIINGSSHSFQHYLCDSYLGSGTLLILSHAITHIIDCVDDKLCLNVNISNITIKSDSLYIPANVTCQSDNVWPNSGVGFYNVSNVHIVNIRMIGCGGILPAGLYPTRNDEPFYFASNQSVSLFFSHATNITIESVTLSQFYGYGIIMVNPTGYTLINNTIITESRGIIQCSLHPDINCTGTGLVIIYSYNNDNNSAVIYHNNESIVYLNNMTFINLYSTVRFTYKLLNERNIQLPISTLSVALAVIYGHGLYSAQVILKNTIIVNSLGSMFGGIAVVFFNSPYNRTQFVLDSCILHHSFHKYVADSGVGILFKMNNHKQFSNNINTTWNSIIIEQTYFIDHLSSESLYNEILSNSAALNIISDIDESLFLTTTISIIHTKYQQRNHAYRCPFIYAQSSHKEGKNGLEIRLSGIHASQRSMSQISSITGRLIFQNVGSVYIEGHANVFEKQVGSAILAYNTDIHLKGKAIFRTNWANYGGAIHLRDYSYLYVYNTTNIHFENNFAAFHGGAISSEENLDIFRENVYCAIQFGQGLNLSNLAIRKSLMYFENNRALLSGNSMYISNMYECKQKHHLWLSDKQLIHLYDHIFKFVDSTNFNSSQMVSDQISSVPVKVCSCEGKLCQTNNRHVFLYPGVFLYLSIVAKDTNNTNTYSLIEPKLSYGKHFDHLKDESWRLNYDHQMQFVSGKGCTSLNYSINLTGLTERSLPRILWLSVPNYPPTLSIVIKKLDCPIGFIEENSSCVCNSFIRSIGITDCNIHTASITLPTNSWLGQVNNDTIGYVSQCPIGYCSNDLTVINMTQLDTMCTGNRKGTLCGQCIEDYSIVFGSTDCHQCTNTSLYIIAVFLLSGIIYVLLLYILRLTIDTGTINGLIFWLNILIIIHDPANVSRYINDIIKWMSIITHLFSFQLWNIPVCIFDGMTALYKSLLMLAIPIYLWLLVIFIIILSKCSTRIANLTVGSSVQVLTTLMHISVSQLYIISVEALMPARVLTDDYNSKLIWYIDGNVSYGKDVGHMTLIIMSLIILMLYIAPYIIIGLFGSKMSCFYRSQYLRPFIESLQGPYKDKFKFWFGMRLLLLTIMYTIYISLRGNNFHLQLLFFAFILGSFILFQVRLMPFKNKAINFLDIWFMVLLEASIISSLYFTNESSSYETKSIVNLLLQGIGTLTCNGVIAYHGFKGVERTKIGKKILQFCSRKANTNDRRQSYSLLSEEDITSSSTVDDEPNTRLRSPLNIVIDHSTRNYKAVGQSEVSLFKNILIQSN